MYIYIYVWGECGVARPPPPTTRGFRVAGTQVRLHDPPYASSGRFRAQVAPRCGSARPPPDKDNQWF